MLPATPDHLTAYTIAQIVRSTARADETAPQTAARTLAIRQMYEDHAPRGAMEGMVVAQIISLRFLVADAMGDLSGLTTTDEVLRQAQQAVTALNRALMSWVKQFDQRR